MADDINSEVTPVSADNKSTDNPDLKTAEELGKYKKAAEEFDNYKSKVDPVLETLWSDPELFKTVTKAHNKRLGIPVDDEEEDKDDKTPVTVSNKDNDDDTRQAMVGQTAREFEKEHGLNLLTHEEREAINGRMMMELKDMLDPKDNKTLKQVLEDVSLSKLPRYLFKALTLAQSDPKVKEILDKNREKFMGNRSDPGMIGTYSSGNSSSSDEIILTEKEKQIASKQGISTEQYLKNKKAILARKNAPV